MDNPIKRYVYIYVNMYAYWVCAAQETPIFSPKFPFRSISFSQMTKKSGPEHHHFTFFAVPETTIFKISLISTRSPPSTAGSARTQSSTASRVSGRPECQPDASWQFRRPAFSSSKRLKLVPEPRIFTLDRGARSGARADFPLCRGTSYLPIFGVSTPPPPPMYAFHGTRYPLDSKSAQCVAFTSSCDTWLIYRQLRASRALTIYKYVPMRTTRALSLYKVYGDSALLVLKGTLLNSVNALLALSRRYYTLTLGLS